MVTDWKQGQPHIIKSLDNTYYSELSFEETKQMLHKETVQLLPMA